MIPLQQRATQVAVLVALSLIIAKLLAYWLSGSVAVLASLVDSSLDAAVSLINMLALRHAMSPPDHDHRFGHGKAEALAALLQAGFITGSAVFLMIQSGQRLARPQPLEAEGLAIGVMLLSMLVTAALVTYQRHVSRKTGSMIVAADALHYLSDLLGNLGVIVAIVLSLKLGWLWADPVFGLVVGLIVLRSAWQVLGRAIGDLMDRELPDEQRLAIERLAATVPGVRGVHELRTRSAGSKNFVQMHIDVDGSLSLQEAHVLAQQVVDQITRQWPDTEVLVHQDPV